MHLVTATVNIFDVQGNMEGAARLMIFAIGIAVLILVADKLFKNTSWW